MGWPFQNNPISYPVQHLIQEFTYNGERTKCEVLDAARVNNTVYLAVRQTDKETRNAHVFAAVILIRNNRQDGFGYNVMDEAMGPVECDCPDRIMRLLSPIEALPDAGFAAEWRERVAARRHRRLMLSARRALLRPGATILLPGPVRFSGGSSGSQFRIVAVIGRRYVLQPVDHLGVFCRLSRDTLAEATVIPAPISGDTSLPQSVQLPSAR
jgi:hypothetical protein